MKEKKIIFIFYLLFHSEYINGVEKEKQLNMEEDKVCTLSDTKFYMFVILVYFVHLSVIAMS